MKPLVFCLCSLNKGSLTKTIQLNSMNVVLVSCSSYIFSTDVQVQVHTPDNIMLKQEGVS